MTELVSRIDGMSGQDKRLSDTKNVELNDPTIRSSSSLSPRRARCRIYAICVPMDELLVNARNQREMYDPDVGHIFGQFDKF
jgi:hypothetical protein